MKIPHKNGEKSLNYYRGTTVDGFLQSVRFDSRRNYVLLMPEQYDFNPSLARRRAQNQSAVRDSPPVVYGVRVFHGFSESGPVTLPEGVVVEPDENNHHKISSLTPIDIGSLLFDISSGTKGVEAIADTIPNAEIRYVNESKISVMIYAPANIIR